MSYLSKEEKREYKEAKKFFGIEAIKLLSIFLVVTLILGGFGVGYKLTVGKASRNADREVFEHSKSYVHGMVDDLAKYKYEYAVAKDDIERNAIRQVILDRFSSFDMELIEDVSLKQFLKEMRGF